MYYLKRNLNNSKVLSYDAMEMLYEYIIALINIRRQIMNKEYKLRKMRYLYCNNICGLKPNQKYQVATMLNHLDNDKSIKKPKRYTLKNIFKIWAKL